jgi:elongator complex protein 3
MDSSIALEILQAAFSADKGIRELDSHTFNTIKKKFIKKHGLKDIPSNIELLTSLPEKEIEKYKHLLITKPTRTGSGVAVVAIMTAPFACKHGKCIYCPGGLNSFFGDIPQSYTGNEPATMRGVRSNFDAYLQVFARLEQYVVLGQNPQKVELIVMGGTFPSFEDQYKEAFICDAYRAMNDFSDMFYVNSEETHRREFDILRFKSFFRLPGKVYDVVRTNQIHEQILQLKKKPTTLDVEKKKNEQSMIRCVALCIETKPDWCKEKQIDEMLHFGATRVEMGVQSLKDEVLKYVMRGHTVKDTIQATQLMKDSFLKVGYHMMPGLPLTTAKEDISMLKELFKNQEYMPDALKIYPTMVMPGTRLEQEFKNGTYKPITTEIAADIIVQAKKYFPEWVRVMRVQRDIPTKFAVAGVEMNNLRQLVAQKAKQHGIQCRCIHCREPRSKTVDLEELKIKRQKYSASGGTELFISVEGTKQDMLVGFARLRIPHHPFRPEIMKNSAGIRELHVYSQALGLGEQGQKGKSSQHIGIGKRLMEEAEKIAIEEYDIRKLLVISGIGVREYYHKLGYGPDGVYVSKSLQ